jgi:hypothetical protein
MKTSYSKFGQNHLAKVRVAGSSPVARSETECRSGTLFKWPSTCLVARLGMLQAANRPRKFHL